MPPISDAHRQLAQAIRRLFDGGIALDADARHFLSSTCDADDATAIASVLSTAEEDGNDAVLELIFFPDTAARLALEPLLATIALSDGDAPAVASALYEDGPFSVTVRVEDAAIPLPIPEWTARRFTERLHLGFRIPEKLTEAIDTHLPDRFREAIRVRLRRSRPDLETRSAAFLANLIRNLGSAPDIPELLEYTITLLGEATDGISGYALLMRKKIFLARSIQQALQLERRMQGNNLETLMMQGVRILSIDKEDARRQIGLIDRIAIGVFGRTDQVDPEERAVELSGAAEDVGRSLS